jgi:hypothetical protein
MNQSEITSLLIIAGTLVLFLGCANINQKNTAQEIQTLKEQTATQVPCPSYTIQIMPNYIINADGSGSWTADCYGAVYKCTQSAKDHQNTTCEQTLPVPVK